MFDPIVEAERQDYDKPANFCQPFDKQLLAYREMGGVALRATLYRPPGRPERPLPAIIFVHGGGWSAGDRGQFARHSAFLAAHHGIAGLCIDYRLTTVAPYPACVQDARAAVRWLQSNAGQFGIDAARIAIGGSSSGAHIAAMVATEGDIESDVEAQAAAVTSQLPLKAAVFCAGVYRLPVDLPDSLTIASMAMLLGGRAEDMPDRYRQASPLGHISPRCPPTLLLHGSADRVISYRQSQEFAARLRQAGVLAEVEIFDGRDHGQLNDPANLARTMGCMVGFLKRYLNIIIN